MSAAPTHINESEKEIKNDSFFSDKDSLNESLNSSNIIANNGFARDPIINKKEKNTFSTDERADFYSGEDRHTLKNSHLERVRELHAINDELQRQIIIKRKELPNSGDELALIADMEHCSILIARNTGEILMIYAQNEARLKRIAEIESINNLLRDEIMQMRDKFISNHDIQLRTKFASEFFLLKDKLENNLSELYELNKD